MDKKEVIFWSLVAVIAVVLILFSRPSEKKPEPIPSSPPQIETDSQNRVIPNYSCIDKDGNELPCKG